MKIIEHQKLYYKEGNSDKVYEVDLCQTDTNEYVVNFRYGRRNARLKEGTKTVFPVELDKAKSIYGDLIKAKIRKGYQATLLSGGTQPTDNLSGLNRNSKIIRYLEQIRPSSHHRQLFLTQLPPFRPLSRGALYHLTQRGFKALAIQATHPGPHALRHACAAHLVAEGLSLKTIGDHLGHRSASATRIYAKVDLPALREVAAFDLGELL